MLPAVPRILHIEDDSANRLLVRKLLTPAGFEVIDAVDGLDGIRKACEVDPDLVLVDIAIPGLDGYEVTLRLRAEPKLRGVPIVAVTAEGNRDTSLAVGCDGFLQKPIDARSFVEVVRGYLGGHREATNPERSGEHLRLQSQRIVSHLEENLAQLMGANARLREADAAKKEFYRNISHELATPMTPIVGYVRLLLDEELGPLSKAQRKALGAMDDCVQRLRGLIDSLLDVTGLETGRLRFSYRNYDVGELCDRVLERRGRALESQGKRAFREQPEGQLAAVGDTDCLGRALDHLLDNALKFSPKGGAIGLRIRRTPSGHELTIADTGPGIPEDKIGRLFEAFYQVDGSPTRSHGGTGVGLAIVHGIVTGHGGTISVRSAGGELIGGQAFGGAAFVVELPRVPSPQTGISLPPPPRSR